MPYYGVSVSVSECEVNQSSSLCSRRVYRATMTNTVITSDYLNTHLIYFKNFKTSSQIRVKRHPEMVVNFEFCLCFAYTIYPKIVAGIEEFVVSSGKF